MKANDWCIILKAPLPLWKHEKKKKERKKEKKISLVKTNWNLHFTEVVLSF